MLAQVTIFAAAILAFGFFAVVALPYLTLDYTVLARYWPRRWWLLRCRILQLQRMKLRRPSRRLQRRGSRQSTPLHVRVY